MRTLEEVIMAVWISEMFDYLNAIKVFFKKCVPTFFARTADVLHVFG